MVATPLYVPFVYPVPAPLIVVPVIVVTVISSASTVNVSVRVYPPPFVSTAAVVTIPEATVMFAVAFVPLP